MSGGVPLRVRLINFTSSSGKIKAYTPASTTNYDYGEIYFKQGSNYIQPSSITQVWASSKDGNNSSISIRSGGYYIFIRNASQSMGSPSVDEFKSFTGISNAEKNSWSRYDNNLKLTYALDVFFGTATADKTSRIQQSSSGMWQNGVILKIDF